MSKIGKPITKNDEKKNQSMSDKIDEMNQTTNKKDIPAGISQKQ